MLVVLFSVLFDGSSGFSAAALSSLFGVLRSAHSIPQAAHSSAFVTGVAFVCILLIVLQWLFPITYTSLGYLSPERVKHTLLLKQLVDVLPIAI